MDKYALIAVGTGALAGAFGALLLWGSENADTLQGEEPAVEVAPVALGVSGDDTAESEWLTAALERVNALGLDAGAIEQVASSLPYPRAQGLRQLAIAMLAERDVSAAIDYALALDTRTARTAALQRVAEIAATADPRFALSLASLIPYGSQHRAYIEQALATWASIDPAAVFAYLEGTTISGGVVLADAFRELASIDPERLLAVVERLPPVTRKASETALIDALLASDPGSAYAWAAALTRGHDQNGFPAGNRERLLTLIANRHSEINPKEALSYLLALDWLPIGLIDSVLADVAAEDLPYALDRAIETLVSGRDRDQDEYGDAMREARLNWLIAAAVQRGATGISDAVDLIANHPDQRVRRQLNGAAPANGLLGGWARVDPEGATAWTILNSSKVSPALIEFLGSASARASGDPSAAQRTLNALPDDLRGYWVAGVAQGLADSSLDAAVTWLERMRGAPVYTTVIDQVLRSAALTQPTTVARLIDNLPDAPRSGLVLTVARGWGSQQPGDAGNWLAAHQRIDDELRALAVEQVVRDWAARDLRDADTWVHGLPGGPFRDSALGAMLPAAVASRALDSRLLGAFSSEQARMQALVGVMDALRRSDPDLGRSLIDRYISDPELRDAAEMQLEGRGSFVLPRVIDGVQLE